jgi:hypothetical protein
MNVRDFFRMIGVNLEIRIYQDGRCCASGAGCETLKNSILTSDYGVGSTPTKSLADYARLISGKRLVVNAWDRANRKEYDVPNLVPKPRATKKKKKISRKRK